MQLQLLLRRRSACPRHHLHHHPLYLHLQALLCPCTVPPSSVRALLCKLSCSGHKVSGRGAVKTLDKSALVQQAQKGAHREGILHVVMFLPLLAEIALHNTPRRSRTAFYASLFQAGARLRSVTTVQAPHLCNDSTCELVELCRSSQPVHLVLRTDRILRLREGSCERKKHSTGP